MKKYFKRDKEKITMNMIVVNGYNNVSQNTT